MTDCQTARFRGRAVVLAAALGLVSCSDGVTGPSDLKGRTWRLESMQTEGGTFRPEDPGQFTVEFNADGTVGVRADCNQCGGSYTLNGDRLTVSPLTCTLIACPTSRGQQFAALLEGTSAVEADDGELEIESPDGELVLTR